MSHTQVLETMHAIKHELVAEVARARGERQLLRTLDGEALLRRAALRQIFNDKVDRLQRTLKSQLSIALSSIAPKQVTVDALCEAVPAGAVALRSALTEIKALAAALIELDALNRSIAERTLGVVRSYVGTLSPPVHAYDFRGVRPATDGNAVHSTRV